MHLALNQVLFWFVVNKKDDEVGFGFDQTQNPIITRKAHYNEIL